MRHVKWIFIRSLGVTRVVFYSLLLLFMMMALVKGVDFAAPLFVICILTAIYNGVGHVYIVGFLKCNFCNRRVGKVFWKADVSSWYSIKRKIVSRGECPHCGNAIFADDDV